MSEVDERPEGTPPPAPTTPGTDQPTNAANAAEAPDAREVSLPLPRRRRRRRVPGVLTRPPMRGPRPERHRPARDAIAAAGRLPGPAGLSETELDCAYDHLDDQLRPVLGPDDATDAVVGVFCCWLTAQDEAGRAVVAAVRAQREEVARAARVLTRMRAKEALIGTIQAERIVDLAALAPIYRRDRRDTLGAAGTFGDPDGEGAAAAFARQEELVAAAGLADLVAELAPALGWSEYTARAQVLLAARVVAVMPHALARLACGQLSMTALTAVANRLVEVDDVAAATIDEHLFGVEAVGVGLTVASLREEVDHQVQLHDPAAASERVRRKTSARRVCWTPLGDGQAKLTLVGPVTALAGVTARVRAAAVANHAAAARAAREGVAAPGGGDPYAEPASPGAGEGEGAGGAPVDGRTVSAHAFDAAVTALGAVRPGALDATSAGWAGGTSVEIRISLPALVGADEDPGYVEGYGWVPAWLVRTGLGWGGCRLRRVLADSFTGDLVAVDGHTYPASWLTDPDDPGPGGSGPAGPGGSGPGSSGPGSSGPARPDSDGDGGSPGPDAGPDGRGGSSCSGGPGGSGPGASGPQVPGDGGPGVPGPGGQTPPTAGAPSTSASSSTSSSTPTGARAGFFKGRPVQQLPPPPTGLSTVTGTTTDLGTDAGDVGDAGDSVDPVDPVDPCAAGGCEPVDPATCPLGAIGGGPHDPPEALRRYVVALWGTSTGPGDRLPAARADLDHVTPWGYLPGQGGSTCACNLDPKSRRWHRRKHTGDARTAAEQPWTARWQHWRCTAGHAHWRSPLGIDHVTRPRRYTDPIPMYRAWAPPSHVQLAGPVRRPVDPTRGFPAEPSF